MPLGQTLIRKQRTKVAEEIQLIILFLIHYMNLKYFFFFQI